MTTKINGLDVRPAAPTGTAAVSRSKDSFNGEGSHVGGGKTGVQITDTARHLATLERLVTSGPVVDEAKVAEVSRAIERGLFEIHPEKIADQLLRLEQSLARASGRMR
jgi:negative regulator of flagellin synthesis FlgM